MRQSSESLLVELALGALGTVEDEFVVHVELSAPAVLAIR
jgi:hypothetical protein